MSSGETLLKALGAEPGCERLARDFYARVALDPVLRPFFPGKSLKCAIEEFGAFLVQFLGGDEDKTQRRWWLSLRESHARFRIGPSARRAWLERMQETLNSAPIDDASRKALLQFFESSSAYIVGTESSPLQDAELATRWEEQRVLEDLTSGIVEGRDHEATALAPRFASRPAVFVGILARMVQTGRVGLISFVVEAVERDPSLATRRSGGRTLLHYASGAGCIDVVVSLLQLGANPDTQDAGGHTPLYRVANECASETGLQIVTALVQAGADLNARGGVTGATPLHMAARRGFAGIARTLLDCGAKTNVLDRKGCTPLQRALNCRKHAVAQLLAEHAAARSVTS